MRRSQHGGIGRADERQHRDDFSTPRTPGDLPRVGSRVPESSETIQQAVAAMNRIADTVRSASGTVAMLGSEINSVSTIASVIKEIADQTNLLALNAAIGQPGPASRARLRRGGRRGAQAGRADDRRRTKSPK